MEVPEVPGADPSDILFVDPFAIDVVDHTGRTNEIVEMAVSLHLKGQRRAVECLLAPDGDMLLKHGYVRTAASRLIRTGFTYRSPETNEEVVVKDRRYWLKVVVSDAARPKSKEQP